MSVFADARSRFEPNKQAHSSRRTGLSLVWTAVTRTMLVGFVGIATDVAYIFFVAHQLQNSADASCLAGAHALRVDVTMARQEAVDIGFDNEAAAAPVQLNSNDANAADGDVVVGRYDRNARLFTPQLAEVNSVRVNARRTDTSLNGSLPLLFGPLFGVAQSNVARMATAMVGGGLGGGIIALNPDASCSFDVRGTAGSVQVNGGVIVVNSDHPTAACHSGRPTIDAEEIHVTGGTDGNWDDQVNFNGELFTGRPPTPDPLAPVPEPFYDPASDLGTVVVNAGETMNVTPGYYSGGFTVRNGTLNVAPGIYTLGGAGLDDNGGNLYAEGSMFHIVDDGKVDLRGNGIIQMSPPDPNLYSYPVSPDPTPYADARITIFQSRTNTNAGRMLGTNQFSILGYIYMPAAHLEIGGTSNQFANGLIVDTFEAHGNGELVINYEGPFPPIPRFVFLVE